MVSTSRPLVPRALCWFSMGRVCTSPTLVMLEAAGSEVREVDPEHFRIYQAGSVFPGLTMSRAFGDTACAGVLQEPSYQQFFMQPEDELYAIIASDGIWEFI